VVGAGPAGLSASLRAVEKGLSYVTLESEDFGGTVSKYPRQKLVMTSPVEFPLSGKFNKLEIGKEELLAFWKKIAAKAGLKIHTQERVEHIQREPDGAFTIETTKGRYRALTVVLAIGRRGTPRKLGVPGEELDKVMYSLIEADHYKSNNILVVGGGDSAVEAAMGLANQVGNLVALSYRQDSFARIKARNLERIEKCMRSGKVKVIFNSKPVEFRQDAVILDVKGERHEITNDFVWIFAGGTPPNDFLKKIGVQLGTRDLTLEAHHEAQEATAGRKELASIS
jgi:thioredoxin reductase (NADPH)